MQCLLCFETDQLAHTLEEVSCDAISLSAASCCWLFQMQRVCGSLQLLTSACCVGVCMLVLSIFTNLVYWLQTLLLHNVEHWGLLCLKHFFMLSCTYFTIAMGVELQCRCAHETKWYRKVRVFVQVCVMCVCEGEREEQESREASAERWKFFIQLSSWSREKRSEPRSSPFESFSLS